MKINLLVAVEEQSSSDGMIKFFEWAKGVGIVIHKGCFVVGNSKLPTVAVVKFKKGVGIVSLDKVWK